MEKLSEEKVSEISKQVNEMNEKERRQFLYKLSEKLGRGGKNYVAVTFSISPNTLNKAKSELENGDTYEDGCRIRKEKQNITRNFLECNQILAIKEKLKTLNEAQRRQYLYSVFEKIKDKTGALKFICTTFNISKDTIYRGKKDYEENDIWNDSMMVRKRNGERRAKLNYHHDSCKIQNTKNDLNSIIEKDSSSEVNQNIGCAEVVTEAASSEPADPPGYGETQDVHAIAATEREDGEAKNALSIELEGISGVSENAAHPNPVEFSISLENHSDSSLFDTNKCDALSINIPAIGASPFIAADINDELNVQDNYQLEDNLLKNSGEDLSSNYNMKYPGYIYREKIDIEPEINFSASRIVIPKIEVNKTELTQDEINLITLVLLGCDEMQRRVFLYIVSTRINNGIEYVSKIFHVSNKTLLNGKYDLESGIYGVKNHRLRTFGGGRKKIEDIDPTILDKMSLMIESTTFGNPMTDELWTSLSHRKIARELYNMYGIDISYKTVGRLLDTLKYSRKKNKKYLQVGEPHPLRDAQFEYINATRDIFSENSWPIISIDTKEKIKLGNFANKGTSYTREGEFIETLDHDFPDKSKEIVVPEGIYCLNNNYGFMNLSFGKATTEVAYNTLLKWWDIYGQYMFPNADRILILCDCGGSNRPNGTLWKEYLSMFSILTGLDVHVCHYPRGCSKYNPIEHRLFSHISMNWQGIPLRTIDICASLIANTKTTTGLVVDCSVEIKPYKSSKKLFIGDYYEDLTIDYVSEWIPQWNYIIRG